MDYKKIGNRYYKVETVEGVETVIKATYNEEEDVYRECGRWTVTEFTDHNKVFDGNTEEVYTDILEELSLE